MLRRPIATTRLIGHKPYNALVINLEKKHDERFIVRH